MRTTLHAMKQLRRRWLRLRLNMASADLAWLERRVPECLAQQRAVVTRLANRLATVDAEEACEATADRVRARIEQRAKRSAL